MEGLDFISEYLAKELSDVKYYDLSLIKVKIKAALIILKDGDISKKDIYTLNKKAKNYLYVIDKHKHDLKYWKDKLRSICSTEQMEEFYKDIDIIRRKNGFN